ncbi:tRNA-modifying protein YgfZ [Aliiglaciecola litoralis]
MQSSFTSPDNFICELSTLGIISINGEDATSYLQGKVTNNVAQLTPDQAQLGCHCDFKGKTWNIFYALGGAQKIEFLCHPESIPASLAELKKYGVFSKVDFSDTTQDHQFVGMAGVEAEKALSKLFGALPQQHLAVVHSELGYVIRFEQPKPRFLVITKSQAANSLLEQLAEYVVDESYWEAMDIVAGIANIQSQTSIEFIPQMMNMQALDAISFDKGCYMGQEVVARTKYLGKNKRAAFILKSNLAAQLQAGDSLEAQVGENWRRSGTVLRSATLEDSTWVLAVLPNDTASDAMLRAKNNPQQTFSVEPLPYSID